MSNFKKKLTIKRWAKCILQITTIHSASHYIWPKMVGRSTKFGLKQRTEKNESQEKST